VLKKFTGKKNAQEKILGWAQINYDGREGTDPRGVERQQVRVGPWLED